MDAQLRDRIEARPVEDVGRVDDLVHGGQAVGRGGAVGVRGVAGLQGPMDLAGAHRIDHHAFAANEIEHGEIRAGLLGEADRVPGGEVAAAAPDHVGVVDIERRAIFAGEIGHVHAGDLRADAGRGGVGGCVRSG